MIIVILPITATLMPTVPTPKVHSTARVIRDTLEMESRVLVCFQIKVNMFSTYIGLFSIS